MNIIAKLLVSLTALALPSVPPVETKNDKPMVERPPQFVMLAFDGSKSLPMWFDTRQFAKDLEAEGKHMRFTYFISAVYYVGGDKKAMYTAPVHGVGKSAIGWGKDSRDLLSRYNHTNFAHQEGHEIASHAVGHWDGGKWTEEEWTSEFAQFNSFIENFFANNSLAPTPAFPNGWAFKITDVTGFRAPQLGWNRALWRVFTRYNYRYDTSMTADPTYWPQRLGPGGPWNFPLATLPIVGTAKTAISMDFNFYNQQSGGKDDPANAALYEQEMYDTYMAYFDGNYYGNRAPVNIGHHFSLWNKGAYWRALKRFAREVCGRPEVKCVTYRELADYMDSLSPEQMKAIRAGRFPKMQPPTATGPSMLAKKPVYYDLKIALSLSQHGRIKAKVTGKDSKSLYEAGMLDAEFSIAGRRVALEHFTLRTVRSRAAGAATVPVGIRLLKDGREILTRTQDVMEVGTGHETMSAAAHEDRALLGDLPEAHLDE